MVKRGNITHQLLLQNKSKFWSMVKKQYGRCWTWTKNNDKDGYGHFEFYIGNGIPYIIKAHRAAYFFNTGKLLPPTIMVCHHCDNPSCVNPDHLFEGNHQDNMDDMNDKDRGRSKLTKSDVVQIRQLLQNNVKLTYTEVAKQFCVNRQTICMVANYVSWTSVDVGPISKRSKIDNQDRQRIKEMHKSGISARKIGLIFGICHHTVLLVVRNQKKER